MPRPKGFEVSKASRAKIAKARTGLKWSHDVKSKIGAGVQHGEKPKAVFSTRIDAGIKDRFEATAKFHKKKIAHATEEAMAEWVDHQARL